MANMGGSKEMELEGGLVRQKDERRRLWCSSGMHCTLDWGLKALKGGMLYYIIICVVERGVGVIRKSGVFKLGLKLVTTGEGRQLSSTPHESLNWQLLRNSVK